MLILRTLALKMIDELGWYSLTNIWPEMSVIDQLTREWREKYPWIPVNSTEKSDILHFVFTKTDPVFGFRLTRWNEEDTDNVNFLLIYIKYKEKSIGQGQVRHY